MPVRTERWPAGTPCWLDISVPDTAAAKDFYGAVMGWEFKDMGPEYADYVIAGRNGVAAAGIAVQQSADQPIGWLMYLASDDVAATAEAVKAHGGQVMIGPMAMPGLGSMCLAVDPQGAGFGVWQEQGMIGAELYNEPGGLVWEQLTVPDADAAGEFYKSLFPLDMVADQGAVMMRRPGDDENIGGISAGTDQRPGWLCYLSVEDAAAAEAEALKRGATSVSKVEATPWGSMGVLADPWGAAFGIGDSKQS